MHLSAQTGKQRRNVLSLYIRSSVTKLWTWYFENEWTAFDANWHKLSTDETGNESTQVTWRQRQLWRPGRSIVLDPLRLSSFSGFVILFVDSRVSPAEQPIGVRLCTVVPHVSPMYLLIFWGNVRPKKTQGSEFAALRNSFDHDYYKNCSLKCVISTRFKIITIEQRKLSEDVRRNVVWFWIFQLWSTLSFITSKRLKTAACN